MSLKQKTITGLAWSFIDTSVKYFLTFFIGILLARLLSPTDFGLIGMTTIFFAISRAFVDSGFSQALIRKQQVSDEELSTVFYINILIAIIFYLLLYAFSGLISDFFNEPKLKLLIRVIGIALVIGSSSSLQQTLLNKRIDFKLQTRITIISTFLAGAVSIFMAYKGYGVWSLVASMLISQIATSFLLWIWSEWLPKAVFSFRSIKNSYHFGSKILYSSLLNTIFNNIYFLVIGKYFSTTDLGYYTRADNFQKMIAENITTNIQRVSYPVLASIQENKPQLKMAYQKLIRGTMFFSFVLMFIMLASAKSMVLTLIGEKWLPSVIYLQMLCFVGMFYPLHAINLNILNVTGRSDLFLKLEIIKKILVIPVLFIGIYFGITAMIIGMMVNTILAYFLNSFWSGKFIDYSVKEQLEDILPSFTLGILTGSVVFIVGKIPNIIPQLCFIFQLLTGFVFTLLICETIKIKDYMFIKLVLLDQIKKLQK